MTKSLHLTGNKYNMAVMVFTVAYISFGVPANIIIKKTGSRSLSIMMFIWGLFAMGQGFTKTWAGIVACRFLMGVFEAGFVPGCAFLMGCYYTKDEFLKRYAIFFSAAIMAGAFNGLFSSFLAMANGAGGLKGWQWIFIVEGVLTSCLALGSFFFMVDFPERSKIFTLEEKDVLAQRQQRDGGVVVHDQIRKHVVEALLDWKVWLPMLAYFGAEENISAITTFQPTVLKGLGFTSQAAQIHSIPIFMVAFVASLSFSYMSERLHQRYIFALFGTILTMAGLVIELAQPKSAGVRYTGMYFITAGTYITMPIIVVWAAINVGKGYKRTVSLGLVIATGNAGALVSSNVFITSQTPKYPTGFSVGIGMNCLSIVCMTAFYIGLRLENRRKKRMLEAGVYATEDLTGEKDPNFINQL